MQERLASWVSVALLAALVAGTWWAADYAQRAVVQDPPRRLTHEIDSYAENFVMVRSDKNGMPTTRMEGDLLEHYPDDDSSEVTQFRAVSQRPERSTMTASSQHARMDQDGARVVLRGDAQLRRLPGQGRPLLDVRSEEVTLLPDEDVAFTDLPANVVNGSTHIQGRGMRYDNVSRELTVNNQTRVQIMPGGAPAPTPPATRRPSKG
ncbi:MAG: LPS export ABC transporter periplasmic protein LptC [Pigmentiphaga sp.]|uniref:LPS export ABC transporter periplasmic protein LptC n=1 Tax=Pigmentiphaga sp. TaxID=1977564 RepID=UPI0029A2AEEB|nr:LPS export ABC transporter periplasmic protein LptC [Pigmentiphaga sp.]MDX3907878.1 LPS export ABC transporter periplasmic protein LptC [Pigmentiphaga sp.]